MINVLIVSGGGFQGSTLIKGLACSSQVRIHLADCFPDNVNKYECDIFHEVPLISKKADFLSRIIQIAVEHNIRIIFPSTDHELELLSRNKESIELNGTKIAVSDHSLCKILIHKAKTYQFLKKYDFPLLDSVDPQSANIDYPIIGKPPHGSGGKGIIVLRNRNEHKQLLKSIHFNDYLWTPFLEKFEEFSVDFAISFDGRISPIIIRKRIRTTSGFAVIAQLESNEMIQLQVSSLAGILKENGGFGIFNVQVIRCNDGILHFSDINPRLGTSSIFTLGIGVNLPLFMCSSFIDCPEASLTIFRTQNQVKMVRNLSEKWIEFMPKGKIKGLVFDLDDTLINQKVWIFDKLRITHDQYANQLPEKEIFMLAAYQIIEEGQRSTLIDELINKFNLPGHLRTELIETYRQAEPQSILVFRDVADNLANLKQLGFKLGLLTDNPVRSQKQKINLLSFAHYFDAIIYSMKFGREKPDKFLFDEMAFQLGENIDRLTMVGDNLYRDCLGALSAGYHAAFLIERKGGFFNFNYSYFENMIKPSMKNIIRISSLNELYYAFEESAA